MTRLSGKENPRASIILMLLGGFSGPRLGLTAESLSCGGCLNSNTALVKIHGRPEAATTRMSLVRTNYIAPPPLILFLRLPFLSLQTRIPTLFSVFHILFIACPIPQRRVKRWDNTPEKRSMCSMCFVETTKQKLIINPWGSGFSNWTRTQSARNIIISCMNSNGKKKISSKHKRS